MVEHLPCKENVTGSMPVAGSILMERRKELKHDR